MGGVGFYCLQGLQSHRKRHIYVDLMFVLNNKNNNHDNNHNNHKNDNDTNSDKHCLNAVAERRCTNREMYKKGPPNLQLLAWVGVWGAK